MPVDFISATKATRSHHVEYKCYLLQYDHNNSKGIRKLVRQPANTRNNISGLGVRCILFGRYFHWGDFHCISANSSRYFHWYTWAIQSTSQTIPSYECPQPQALIPLLGVLVFSAVYPQVMIVKLMLLLCISTEGVHWLSESSINRPLWTTWGWSFAHNTHLVHVTRTYEKHSIN